MGYSFPNSPAVGDVANGYIWNGAAWTGQAAPLVGETEKFIDLSGLTSADIAVPTWAKGCHIEGMATATSGAVILRMSTDGTTFYAGASDYTDSAASHSTGSTGYATGAAVASSWVALTATSDDAVTTQSFNADVNLVRQASIGRFVCKSYGKSYNTAANSQYRTWWGFGSLNNSVVGAALAIKALRITMHSSVAFGAGSWVRVKWFGPQTENPTGAAIVTDAPADGREYVRVNGTWRLKGQLVDLTGASQAAPVIVSIPLWAKFFRLQGQVFINAAGSFIQMQVSTDGVNWVNGANDYSTGGFVHNCGSAGFANYPTSQTTAFLLTVGGDNLILAQSFDVLGEIEARAASGAILGGLQINSHSLDSGAATLMRNFVARAYVNIAQPVGTRIQMMRFFPNTAQAWQNGSRMSVEWS